MPDPLFNDLYDDTRDLAWQATDQVRARGAQRTRRQRLAAVTAAAAAMLVVAGGAVALAGPQAARPVQPAPADSTYRPAPVTSSPAPSLSATSSPSGTASQSAETTESTTGTRPPTTKSRALPQGPVPNAAMLQIADVARGEMGVFDLHGFEEGNDDWRMPVKAQDCDGDKNAPPVKFLHEHQRTLVHEEDPDGMVVERVLRFATADQARKHLADVQTMVRACMRAGDGVFLSIVVRDFAGPGSMLVRWTDGENKILTVWVRRGNLVAEVWKKKMPTDQEAVRLGERAAARLCAGTVC